MKVSGPKIILHIEGLAVLLAAVAFYRHLGASWVTFAVLFLAPDLFMFGYLFGNKSGARIYNSVHTFIGPFLLWAVASILGQPSPMPVCLIWVAHIGFDRLMGYGLKYATAFKDTHLNRV